MSRIPRNRRLGLEPLEPRCLLSAAPVRINEFMAVNHDGLADEDGARSDWIELYNSSAAPVDLFGWHLTDNAANLLKWTFPHKTLGAGQYLVVFASGKDRAGTGPNGELHTNFQLNGDGEYLALIQSDGVTKATEFAPTYPPQQEDIAYGVGQDVLGSYVSTSATLRYFVPSDDSLGRQWTGGNEPFTDSGWTQGTNGAGYDLDSPTPAPAKPIGYWNFENQMLDVSGSSKDGLAFGAYPTAAAPAVLGAGTSYSFDGSSNTIMGDYLGVPIDVSETAYAVSLWFKADTGSHGLFSVADSDIGGSFDRSIWLNGTNLAAKVNSEAITTSGKNYVDGQWHHVVHTFGGTAGGQKLYVDGAQVAAGATATSSYSGQKWINIGYDRNASIPYFDGLIDDVAIWSQGLNLAQVQALRSGTSPMALGGYLPLAGTDLTAMKGTNATVYVRIPFTVSDAMDFDALALRIQYDDGFVVYLNGTEVARRNAPAALAWNSAATADRTKAQAIVAEQIDLTQYRNLLHAGQNLLAVQGLNDTAASNDFLVRPELVKLTSGGGRSMIAPSPGAANDMGQTAAVQFSKPAGAYATTFQLTLSVPQAGTVIRYTTDGTIPTGTSPAYSAPINVSTSMRFRARAFDATRGWGPIVSQSYLFLETNVATFTSDLPLILLDTFGNTTMGDTLLTPVSGLFLEPGAGGRTVTTAAPDLFARGGIRIRGSSSQGFEKKQYAYETWGENVQDNAVIDSMYAEDRDVSLFGLPADSDWILNGPYSDKSLMRNALSYQWSGDMGRYSVRTQYVELFLNTDGGKLNYATDYLGVYVLMEKIKVGEDRVDIAPLTPADNAEPAISGGYIFKKDRIEADELDLPTSMQNFVLVEPKAIDVTDAQRNYLINYITQFEAALNGANFADPAGGYAKYINPQTWIYTWLTVEMCKQIDGYRLSSFYYKDRNGKINMGPDWDYNLALGNADYLTGWLTNGWYCDQLSDGDFPYFRRLYQDPNFKQLLADTWYSLRQGPFKTSELAADIDADAAELNEAQVRNFQRWQILGVELWPNWYVGATWQDEVKWMKAWLATGNADGTNVLSRVDWMDTQFVKTAAFSSNGLGVSNGLKVTLTAPAGAIYYTTDGSDPRLSGGGISPKAVRYTAPFSLAAPGLVRARVLDSTASGLYKSNWSAPAEATFLEHAAASSTNLAITELNYNPYPPSAAELAINPNFTDADFEFIELKNNSAALIDLTSVQFTAGITFAFPDGDTIPAGGYVVLVVNQAAFQARYGTSIPIAGTYTGQLSNGGEHVLLTGLNAQTLHEFTYSDSGAWPGRPDGKGSTLELLSNAGDYNSPDNWRASVDFNGSPGRAGTLPGSDVAINEVLAHTDPPLYDAIELYNSTAAAIDIGGWYLSDSGSNYKKYRIPDGTMLGAGQYLAYDGTSFDIVPFASATQGLGGTWLDEDSGATLHLTGNGWKRIKLPRGISVNTVLEFDFKSTAGGVLQGIGVARDDTLDLNSIFRLAGSGAAGRSDFADYAGVDWKHYTIPLGEFAALAENGLVFVNDADGENPASPAQCYFSNVIIREQGATGQAVNFSTYFGLNAAHGDDVYLTKSDAAGNVIAFTDHVDFPAQANGESWGRWQDDQGNWHMVPMRQRTLGAANGTGGNGPRVGPLVISEIMYAPKRYSTTAPLSPAETAAGFTSLDQMEYLEIYNPTGSAVDLTNWRLSGTITYAFAAGTILPARSAMLVVSFDPAANNGSMLNAFRASTRYNFGTTVKVVGPYTNYLVDTGGEVKLLRPDAPPLDEPTFYPGLLEDDAAYASGMGANGDGMSLSRQSITSWGLNQSSWAAGSTSAGASGQVVARYIFYNNSAFDRTSDDAAIATDKTALLPGGQASFANYTSFSRGVNGLMLDVAGLASGTLRSSDFEFKVGNSSNLSTWTAVATAPSITVRPAVNGISRVVLVWADNAILNQWLQVTVKATASTGLAVADTFYFGNAVGETGNNASGPSADAAVDIADEAAVRAAGTVLPTSLTNRYDFNHDRKVNATDQLIARANYRQGANALQLINLTGAASAAQAGGAGVSPVVVATVAESTSYQVPSTQYPVQRTVYSVPRRPLPTPPVPAVAAANAAHDAVLLAVKPSLLLSIRAAELAWLGEAGLTSLRGASATQASSPSEQSVDRLLAALRFGATLEAF